MFTKEAIALAKPFNDALKKIAERQEKECPECLGRGYLYIHHHADCKRCKGTGKLKWEWEPEQGQWCINKEGGYPQLISDTTKDTGDIYLSSKSGHIWLHSVNFIPLLHWEQIEEILEKMGYEVRTFDIQVKRRRWLCHIWKKGKLKETAPRNKLVASVDNCKSRQLAVMRAVIELGKED